MKKLMLFIVVFPLFAIQAQQQLPGGVNGVYLWEITESIPFDSARWKSNLKTESDLGLTITGKRNTLNNNPALFLNANIINKTLNLGKSDAFCLFTVCEENDTLTEKVIVSLENDTAPEFVLTNLRMAALDVYQYANFCQNKNLLPKIFFYAQNKSKDSATLAHKLWLGRPPRNEHLPVAAYYGIIPEMILFDRFISNQERLKVESYLALKYGISLNQEFPVSYLNSKGEIIWDAEINAFHNQNIAGIARDDMSGLYQKVSESIQTPGVMKIGLTGEMTNYSFMIWGDNGGPLRFSDEAGVRPLQREWKIVTSPSNADSVYIITEVMSLSEINPLRDGEKYWMMIDRSGIGNYPYQQTSYIQCPTMTSERGSVFFNKIFFDPDHSGSDIFTLLAAPIFFTRSRVISPTCSSASAGSVLTDIAGGSPPYHLNLKNTSGNGFQVLATEYSSFHTFEGLSQGSYVLEVTDSKDNTCTEKIIVTNSHQWESQILQNYNLYEGQSLILDASKGMPDSDYNYAWTLPDGSSLDFKTICITQPGIYQLTVTDNNNCSSTFEIKVKQTLNKNLKYFELFPNPSDGRFVLRIELIRSAAVIISITDISGRILKQNLLQNDCFYWYSDVIQKPGLYCIVITTGNEKETLKLIIQ